MRKVMFKKYIKPIIQPFDAGKNLIIKKGTGIFENDFSNSGYFHEWAIVNTKIHNETVNTLVPLTVALIEDDQGFIHEVQPENIKFISPPEDDIQITGHRIDEVKEYGINSGFNINTIMKTEDK